jgi:hypothetical protein
MFGATTPDDTIEQIESNWKNKLLTRAFGLNRNLTFASEAISCRSPFG